MLIPNLEDGLLIPFINQELLSHVQGLILQIVIRK